MHIEPQENAARRRPLSDIERAVGAVRPTVSNLTGSLFLSFLSTLNKPVFDVEKKNVKESVGSNSSSIVYTIVSNGSVLTLLPPTLIGIPGVISMTWSQLNKLSE